MVNFINLDSEMRVNRPVVRDGDLRPVILHHRHRGYLLAEENAIRPGSRFILVSTVEVVCADIVLVGGREPNLTLLASLK